MPATSIPSLQELFQEQRSSIQYFYENLAMEEVEQVFELCLKCKGILATAGVGKSGLVAEKVARTLISTGTRSLFLPPSNLLHGDIGALSEGDVVLLFSKSGKTEDLLDMVAPIRRRGGKVVAITSVRGSLLEAAADASVCLPVNKELCPFDLAPTTSAAVQLLFGDALAVYLMREKGFSLEEYAESHPSGAIGKKITSLVSDLMFGLERLPLCSPEDRLVDVLVELSSKKCGALLVHEEGELKGIFTDGDLRRGLQREGGIVLEKKVGELMTKSPITVAPSERAAVAAARMQEKRYVMVAPVIENNKIVGLIRLHDIIHEGIA